MTLKWEPLKAENIKAAFLRVYRLEGQRGAEFEYEAQRSSKPRAVLGNGFLCGFDYQGVWRGPTEERLEGEGYSEQLGWVTG